MRGGVSRAVPAPWWDGEELLLWHGGEEEEVALLAGRALGAPGGGRR